MAESEELPPLWQLWHALLDHLLAALSPGAEPTAHMLNVARHFLRENGITAVHRREVHTGLRSLADLSKLPFDPPQSN